MQMKTAFAYMVLHFDMKLEDGCGRPKNTTFGHMVTASPDAKFLLKRRTVAEA